MARKGPYLPQEDDAFFTRPFEEGHKPKTQNEYARLLGVPIKTVAGHLLHHRPQLWSDIRNRIERARAEEKKSEIAERVTEAARRDDLSHKQRKVYEEVHDVSTLQGRKIEAQAREIKELKTQRDHLQDRVFGQRQFLEEVVAAASDPLPRPNWTVKKRSSKRKDKRGILLPIFDMQIGAKVIPDDTVNGLGAFDSNILQERAKHYVEVVSKIIYAQAENFGIGPIVFALGGDIVEGDEIFEDQAWQLEMPVPEQIVLARDVLTYMIEAILEAGTEVGAEMASIFCVLGNHGRRGKKRGGRKKNDNYDWLTYMWLEDRLKNYPLFNFVIDTGGQLQV